MLNRSWLKPSIIRRTLRKQPGRVLAYNNGISATAGEIVLTPGGDAVASVRGLQIVNGGQTLAALHHATKVEKIDLGAVQLATNLIRVGRGEVLAFVGEVSSYANTQSIVQIADFSANRTFHIDLERLSRKVWIPGQRGLWFFERTRGQYKVAQSRESPTKAARRKFKERCPAARRFSKTDLAKYVNAWAKLPHLVSNGAQYRYRSWLAEAEKSDWAPDEVWYREFITKAIIWRAAQQVVKDGEFEGYRAQIVPTSYPS